MIDYYELRYSMYLKKLNLLIQYLKKIKSKRVWIYIISYIKEEKNTYLNYWIGLLEPFLDLFKL